jgi:hypothetical protein
MSLVGRQTDDDGQQDEPWFDGNRTGPRRSPGRDGHLARFGIDSSEVTVQTDQCGEFSGGPASIAAPHPLTTAPHEPGGSLESPIQVSEEPVLRAGVRRSERLRRRQPCTKLARRPGTW